MVGKAATSGLLLHIRRVLISVLSLPVVTDKDNVEEARFILAHGFRGSVNGQLLPLLKGGPSIMAEQGGEGRLSTRAARKQRELARWCQVQNINPRGPIPMMHFL